MAGGGDAGIAEALLIKEGMVTRKVLLRHLLGKFPLVLPC